MSERVFLYKELNTNDRDCVKYIYNEPMRFECDHYFGSVNLQGSCFSMGLNELEKTDYKNITTILSKEEIDLLIEFDKNISELGSGIKIGDDRYKKGVQLCKDIMPVYDRLNSEDNQALFEKVILEEKAFLCDEYSLTEDYIDEIFDNYGLEYRDRSVISCIFEDVEELGREEAEAFGYLNDEISKRYFDYKSFGEDLVEEERYHQLDDDRVVHLNY